MSDLTDFLLARIAEDEALANTFHPESYPTLYPSPARVLAECEAKRRIVETARAHRKRAKKAWKEYSRWVEGKPVPEPGTPSYASDSDVSRAHDATLRHLTTVYADHPDYREKWRA